MLAKSETKLERRSAIPALLVLLAIAFIGLAAELVWLSPPRGKTAIEILKIVASWPVAVTLLAILAGVHFHSQISALLSRMVRGKWTGGVEFEFQALVAGASSQVGHEIALTPEQIQEIRDELARLEHDRQATVDTAISLLTEKEQEILFWRFQYLNSFLVQRSKIILRWVDDGLIRTVAALDQYCRQHAIADEEALAVYQALLNTGVMVDEDGLLGVTPLGRQFLHFIGLRAF